MTIYCVSVCPTGSYLQSTASYTCVICPNNCLACSAIDACSLCVTGTFLINGICSKYCPAQTYNNGSACLDCPSSAVSCVSSSVSTSCSPSTYLYTNGTTSQCVTACPSGYYPDPTQICLKCLTTCLTCSS